MEPNITIQIVGWNSAKHLPATVRALQAISPGEVIIRYIDNGSTDASVEIVRQALPQADILALVENKGFAPAHNIGFSKCTTPFVLTHDPDVELNWEGLKKLLTYIESHSEIAAVQGKLLRKESNLIDSAGITLTLAFNGKERGAGGEDAGQYNEPAEIDAVTGACGLYRMDALKKIAHRAAHPSGLNRGDKAQAGLIEVFDNDFFAYKEDVDLGWRLKRAGFKSMYLPILMGHHSRTLGKRGAIPWFMNPEEFPERLKSLRTHYSLRNYIWMLVKNVSVKKVLLNIWFIIPRLAYWLLLSIAYPPLFKTWDETFRGIPNMIKKRKQAGLH